VIEDYFSPILCGTLEVIVEGLDGTAVLTVASLISEMEKFNGNIAAWMRAQEPEEFVTEPGGFQALLGLITGPAEVIAALETAEGMWVIAADDSDVEARIMNGEVGTRRL
jgi:hypothetical protein